MKKSIILLASVLFSIIAFAQTDEDKKKLRDEINSKDRVVIELTHDNMYTQNDAIDLGDTLGIQWYSRGFNMYLMYDVNIGDSRFSIAPGIGISSKNYFLESELVPTFDTSGRRDGTAVVPIDENRDFRKYKLNPVFVDVPLELRYRSRPDVNGRSFKLGLGLKGGYLLDAKTKYKGDASVTSSNQIRIKDKDDSVEDLNKFRYGVTARIGYGAINIFGFYGLSTVFETDRGIEAYPFSVGISINGL